jgi:hypothetical protein
MDVQESPAADLALAALTVGALRLLTEEVLSPFSHQASLGVPELAPVFLGCIREGERTVVEGGAFLSALGVRASRTSVEELWWHLLEEVEGAGLIAQAGQGERLRDILRRGPLARQILRALDLPEDGSPDRGPPPSREALEEVYRALAVCLAKGEIFGG